jgi:hypothetical protein
MPRANPSESIKVAARHLFRHLDDPAELRRNPIVAHYFDCNADGSDGIAALEAIVAVRRAVRLAADCCELDDRNAGLHRRAKRNAILLEQLCTGSDSYRVAAKTLGLSVPQYYRTKQALCLRIARAMSRSAPRFVPHCTDSAWARLEVAERRAGLGDFSGAQAICVDLAAYAPSSAVRVRALCLVASVERERGSLTRSRSFLAQATAALEAGREQMMPGDALIAECYVKLWAARIAFDGPRSREGLQILEDAIRRAPTEQSIGDLALRAVLADLLAEGAEQHEALGDFVRAKALAALAAERARSLPETFPQKSFVARTMSRLQWVAPGVQERPNLANRLNNFHTALDLARHSGSLENQVRSLLNLMSVHVVLGDAKAATAYSQQALRLAVDFGGRRLGAMARLEITDALVSGSRWRLVGAMLATLGDAFDNGSYSWLFCKLFEAIYLAKTGQLERSIAVATESEKRASVAGYTRICGGLQRVVASSAHAIGRKVLAHEQIRASIDTVCRSGSLLSLGNAYRIAADITGERRYADLAREIGTELAM